MMEDEIGSIRAHKSTIRELENIKKYPRETNEEVLLRLIKQEVEKCQNKNLI